MRQEEAYDEPFVEATSFRARLCVCNLLSIFGAGKHTEESSARGW